jgi:hypothetical protein
MGNSRHRARGVVSIAVLVALVASGCSQGGSSGPKAASAHKPATASTEVSSQQVIAALAGVGIATFADETTRTPEVPVRGAQVFAVTAWQAANLAREATARGGITGADLDASVPMGGAPPFADLLGGWILATKDPASVAAGRVLGPVDWEHTHDIVFPEEVVDLFVGDVLQHIAQAHTSASTQGVAVARLLVARPVAAPILSAPCSGIADFFQTILSKVFDALKLDPTAVADWVSGKLGGGTLGTIVGGAFGWLASAWNRAVDLARSATETFLTQLTQPAINLLRLAIGAVATFTTVVSYLKRWDAPVTADPPSNSFSVAGAAKHTGTVTASVDAKDEIKDWPEQLVDCAKVVNVTLPTLSRAGRPATWKVLEPESLVVINEPKGPPFTTPLDEKLSASLTYTAGSEDAETHATGTLVTPAINATVNIERTEVEDLRDLVTKFLENQVPGFLRPVADPILASFIGLATKQLNALIGVDGSLLIVVSHHVPKPPKPKPKPLPPKCVTNGSAIPAGTYATTIGATIITSMHINIPGGPQIPNAGGGTEPLHGTVSITSNGRSVTGKISLTGSGTAHVGLPGAVNVHSNDKGSLTGTISGPATAPVFTGILSGEWASFDAPVINGSGSASNTAHSSLHITRVSCTSISGDVVAMFRDFAAPVAQYLTISGTGTWTAPRT